MIRAYNDWHIDEWCGAYPGRFIPLALSGFMLGAEWMAGEIRRVAEKGCHAVSFHAEPHRFGMPDHHGDEWDPAWQACNDTGTVMVFHFGGVAQLHAPLAVRRDPHPCRSRPAIFAPSCCGRRSCASSRTSSSRSPRAASAGSRTSSSRPTTCTSTTSPWTGSDFGDKLPSQVFREHVQTCFIDDVTGLRNRDEIGVDKITWECDYPHSDSTWPQSPEDMEVVPGGRLPDDEIDKITWENACRLYKFDPFEHRTREECTVGALRAQAPTSTPRRGSTAGFHRCRGEGSSTRGTPPTSWPPTTHRGRLARRLARR